MHNISPTFQQRVWLILSEIPYGKVTSYGEIARWAGSPGAARQVAKTLKNLPKDSCHPWHRVINAQGRISLTGPDLQRQRDALRLEGVEVTEGGKVDMKVYRWRQ